MSPPRSFSATRHAGRHRLNGSADTAARTRGIETDVCSACSSIFFWLPFHTHTVGVSPLLAAADCCRSFFFLSFLSRDGRAQEKLAASASSEPKSCRKNLVPLRMEWLIRPKSEEQWLFSATITSTTGARVRYGQNSFVFTCSKKEEEEGAVGISKNWSEDRKGSGFDGSHQLPCTLARGWENLHLD
jgi:hypothetical protein